MKQTLLLLITLLLIAIQSETTAQELKFKINNQKDTTVFLIKYVGGQLYYADTAQIKKGIVTFDGKKQEQGIMGVFLPGQKFFEFLNCGEDIFIETTYPDFIPTMKIHKSIENKVFLDYINFMTKNSEQAKNLSAKREGLPASDEEGRKQIDNEINEMGKRVKELQHKLWEENKDKLVGKIIRMSTDIEIPEAPKNPDGTFVDKEFGYKYLRDNYFSNVDLTDSRLVNTPILQKKLEYFYSQQMLLPHPDTLIKYLTRVVDQIPTGTLMYRFFVTKITANFEKSKIMGMDKVVNTFVYRYYCPKDENGNYRGFWMEEEKLEELCADAKKRVRLMQGEIPPNVILPDTTNKNWLDFYSLKSDYIILYFWDPGCGHCKKETPKLQKLYTEKLKARNVEIFAVGKATGSDFEDWKKFIKKNNLQFINVGLTQEIYNQAKKDPLSLIPSKTTLESLNYQDTYDIFSTPRVWILDKDKKIVGKGLGVAQIEEYLDRLQGFEDAPKIFSVEEEKKANNDQ
jgi:thiol-disulfide isomerase/thioredoxin